MLAPTQPPTPATDPTPLHTSVPGFSLLPADGHSDARPLITAHSLDGAPTAPMLLDSGSDTCLIMGPSVCVGVIRQWDRCSRTVGPVGS